MDNFLDFQVNPNNKLFNDIFNHVGLHELESHAVDDVAMVRLKGQELGRAKVVAIHTFPFSKISDVIAFVTIGRPAHVLAEQVRRTAPEKLKVYADTLLSHVVYQYTERNLPNQQQLLTVWWQELLNSTDPVFDESTIYHQ